jgi:hypothetical protein
MTKSKDWTEPESATNEKNPPTFPYVNSTYTESGHLFMMNDTPDQENIRLQHRSGTFMEMHPKGDVVFKTIKGNNYEIISDGNKNVYIKGDCNVHIESDCSLHINGDYNLQIDGDFVQKVKGNITHLNDNDNGSNHSVNGDYMIASKNGNVVLNVQEGQKVEINGDLQVNGNINCNQNISAVGNISSQQSLFAVMSIKTLGSAYIGPVSGLTPTDAVVPGLCMVDTTIICTGTIEVALAGFFGGIVTAMDMFFMNPGTFFSLHKHIAPLGITSPPVP